MRFLVIGKVFLYCFAIYYLPCIIISIIKASIERVISSYTELNKGYSCSFISVGEGRSVTVTKPYECVNSCLNFDVQSKDMVALVRRECYPCGYRIDGYDSGNARLTVAHGTKDGIRKTHVYYVRVWNRFITYAYYALLILWVFVAIRVSLIVSGIWVY